MPPLLVSVDGVPVVVPVVVSLVISTQAAARVPPLKMKFWRAPAPWLPLMPLALSNLPDPDRVKVEEPLPAVSAAMIREPVPTLKVPPETV